jgi:hypothetical protein
MKQGATTVEQQAGNAVATLVAISPYGVANADPIGMVCFITSSATAAPLS